MRVNYDELSSIYSVCSREGLIPEILPTIDGKGLGKTDAHIFSVQDYMKEKGNRKNPLEMFAKRLVDLHLQLDKLNIKAIENHADRVVCDIHSAANAYDLDVFLPAIDKADKIVKDYPMQVIHNDLHPQNVIFHNDQMYFLDFDSARSFVPISDVAVASFRFSNGNPNIIYQFVDFYNSCNDCFQISKSHIWYFLVYKFLQNILFILIEKDSGNSSWMWDLENQKKYLDKVQPYIT